MDKSRKNRAQLHTLEGVAASIILLLAMSYAFNAFVVTPTSDVNPGTESNQQLAEDLLVASDSNGNLKDALLHWDTDQHGFKNTSVSTYYYEGTDPDPSGLQLGEDLRSILTEEGLSYNLEASFSKEDSTGTLKIVDQGEPGASAVTASRTVILEDDDTLISDESVIETDEYPIPKDGDAIYNRIEVRITVW